MFGILDLPTELACEIVGKWLCLKDVVLLDSAFCHKEVRDVLHDSIFQSPLCIVVVADSLKSIAPAIFTWVSMKFIRLSTLYVTNGVEYHRCEDYVKRFGDTVHSVAFRSCRGDFSLLLTLVSRYCTNLRVLTMFYCDVSPWINVLKSCGLLRSIDVTSSPSSTLLDTSIPATRHLPIASIKLDCSSSDEVVILRMCDPLCVQRLRLNNSQLPEWQTFVNLRSFGFYYDSFMHDANLLATICTLCPWIVNLAVSGFDPLMDDMVVPALQALNQLRTFNCEFQEVLTDDILHTLIEHHKHSLEAVYLYECDAVSGSAINRLLKDCVQIHTLSCIVWDDIAYSLMSNLTTLIMNYPNMDVWNGVQQHCHSLRHLHFAQILFATKVVYTPINVDDGNLPVLRTVYTAREYVHDMRVQLPSVCVVGEVEGEWYDLFELPI